MPDYKLLPDIATADVAFEVENQSLERLFEICAEATFDVMVDRSKVEEKVKKEFYLENDSEDKLLYDFIEELIFLKDAESLVFSKFKVEISGTSLRVECYGDEVKEEHRMNVDVKAMTLHMYYLKKIEGKWKARIVLDI
jgi:SHS2 domain-containing protein